MERPWIKFFTRDYLDDRPLRKCSPAARALWVDMFCLMNEGNPHGFLADSLGPHDDKYLAQLSGIPLAVTKKLIAELESFKIFSRDEQGVIFSRRMVRDEQVRQRRAEGGPLGGNPAIKVNHKVNLTPNLTVESKVNLTPNLTGKDKVNLPASRAIRACALTLTSDSDSASSRSGNFDFADWFERQYARHPKKGGKTLAANYAVEKYSAGELDPVLFERRHIAWCQCEEWTWKGGVKVKQTLAEWIQDDGWKYEPRASDDPEPDEYPRVMM